MTHWKFNNESIVFSGTATIKIQAWCEDGPYARINATGPQLPEGQFWLKDWSENAPIAEAMIAEGLIEEVTPPQYFQTGFVTAKAYIFTAKGKQYCV